MTIAQSTPEGLRPLLYRFGNSAICSTVELPQLSLWESLANDAAIRVELFSLNGEPEQVEQWHHQWPDDTGHAALQMAKLGGAQFLLRFPTLCDFLVDTERNRIGIRPHTSLPPHILEHLVVDQVLPRFLAHSGSLLMHAGAVRVGARCVLFIGKSGWGKSTLTALLVRAGHAALSDDCIVLRTVNGELFATPSYPSLRLLRDSVANVFPAAAQAAQDDQFVRKLRLPTAAAEDSEGGPRVDAIYFLNDPAEAADKHAISAHAPAASCIAMFQHAFLLDATDRDRTRMLFSQCCDAVRAVPTFLLTYPRDFTQTGTLVELITKHLDALRADASTGAL